MNTLKSLMLFTMTLILTLSSLSWGESRGIGLVEKTTSPSKPKSVIYDPNKNYAVIIGINNYQAWPDLKSAKNDAVAIKQLLVKEFSFPSENIYELYDENANKNNILKTLRDLRKLDDNSNLLIYYAGHGWLDEETQEGFWISSEVGVENAWEGISTSNLLNSYLKPLKVRHLAIIVDACFGGALLNSRGIERSPFHAKKYSRRSRVALTSGNLEPVPDDGGSGFSVFNLKLQQYLNGSLPGSDKEFFTLTELYAAIAPEVSRYSSSSQEPILARLNDPNDEKGEYVFYRKARGIKELPYDLENDQIGGFFGGASQSSGHGNINSLNSSSAQFRFNYHSAASFSSVINNVEFFEDKNLVAISIKNRVELLDLGDLSILETLEIDSPVTTISTHGDLLAIGTRSKNLFLYNTNDRSMRKVGCSYKNIKFLSFSDSGFLAVAFRTGAIEVVDIARGRVISDLRSKEAKKKTFFGKPLSGLSALILSPDGSIAVCVNKKQSIEFWNTVTRRKERSIQENADEIFGASVSDDGTLVAIARKNIEIILSGGGRQRVDHESLVIRRTDSGEEIKVIEVDKDILYVHFYSNKRYLLIASSDNKLRVYDIVTGNVVSELKLEGKPTAFAASGDGSMLAYASNGELLFYEF